MPEVALARGSNLGDSAAILQGAVSDLCAVDGLVLDEVSPVYEADPVGGPDQDPYLNAVAVGRTTLSGPDLLAATQAVEAAWHRVRGVRWGPRTLDVDILTLGDEVVDTPTLTIPHPRAHERAFVLVPWNDVAPGAVVPGHGTVADLRRAVDATGVRATQVVLRLTDGGGSS
jgi:2-amino-4-hydroxy-6-hydroxymethyldihydropteridine diphosphokinase